MTKFRLTAALLVLALTLSSGPAGAQDDAEKAWSFDIGVDYASLYLFRGSDLLADEPVFIPYARYAYGNFAVYYYGYFGELPIGDYQESDFGADYTFGFGDKVSLTVGAVAYLYNSDAEDEIAFFDTTEVYGILAFDTFLSPTLSYWYDIDELEAGYAQFLLSHSFALGDKASLDLSAGVGFDFGYNNPDEDDGTLNDFLVGLNIPWQVTDSFALRAMVQQSIALDSLDARRDSDPAGFEESSEDETVFTVGGSFSF